MANDSNQSPGTSAQITASVAGAPAALDPATWIRNFAATAPDRPALIDVTGTLDYASLAQRVDALAVILRTHGANRDSLIGVACRNRREALIAIQAILATGAAYVPFDLAYPPARLAAMVEDSRPLLILGDGNPAGFLDLPKDTVWLDPSTVAQTTSESVQSSSIERHDGAASLAYVLFTSGSTGRPKGVAMRAAPLAHLIAWHVAHPRLGAAARTLQFAPLSFDVSFQEIAATFASGGTLVLPSEEERRDPFALLALIEREQIERVFMPYVALQALAEAVAAGGSLPATLRDVVTAGEQLRSTPAIRELFTALPNCRLHNHYGPTETHVVTALELSDQPQQWPDLPSIGTPLPHVSLRVVDTQLNAQATGNEGELLIGGDCLAAGYIHRPELTAERFIELDGARWYRSGDLARIDADGSVAYLGRIDTQIKVAGHRVEPGEIEAVLTRHPAVVEAIVVASDERLVAHVVPRDLHGDEATLVPQLRTHCEALLAPYLLPQAWLFHAALPTTPSGKIDRAALARHSAQPEFHWPDDAPLATQLVALWSQLLGVEKIDTRANLFDLGARSLSVVRALTELRRHGHALSASQIYEHSSVAAQVVLLERDSAKSDPTIEAASQRGEQQRAALNRFGPRAGAAR
ncbi:MAG: non-ribosomal peptide synthetase [Dokdonella sp.]